MKEPYKNLQREKETNVDVVKAREDEVGALGERLCESLQRTMKGVHEVLSEAVEQAKELCHDVLIPVEALNPFKAAPEGSFEGDQVALSLGAKA